LLGLGTPSSGVLQLALCPCMRCITIHTSKVSGPKLSRRAQFLLYLPSPLASVPEDLGSSYPKPGHQAPRPLQIPGHGQETAFPCRSCSPGVPEQSFLCSSSKPQYRRTSHGKVFRVDLVSWPGFCICSFRTKLAGKDLKLFFFSFHL
jgi:hypothetical protein